MQIDFTRDVQKRCIERLVEAGYAPPVLGGEEAIRAYISIRHRRVRAMPRVVRRANYFVSDHFVCGEKYLLSKVSAGDDLWPHQSRKIDKLSGEDPMLNDFGIQHFHLGTAPDARNPSLIQGTKELLFAFVRDDAFYAIGIYDHDAWNKHELMEIVHQTWPELTAPYTLKGADSLYPISLRQTYTEEDAARLRAANINSFQQRSDGKIQMGMGGGIASDGSSVSVTRETDKFVEHVERLQNEVQEAVSQFVQAGQFPIDSEVFLEWRGDEVLVRSLPPGVDGELTGRLAVPPL